MGTANCEIAGIELADEFAGEGSASTFIGPEPYHKPRSTVKEIIVKWKEIENLNRFLRRAGKFLD